MKDLAFLAKPRLNSTYFSPVPPRFAAPGGGVGVTIGH